MKKYLYLLSSLFLFSACNEDVASLVPPITTTVEFEYSKIFVSENIDTANIKLVLSTVAKEDVYVDLEIKSGSAKEGQHFDLLSKTIHFSKGHITANVPVFIYDDTIVGVNKKFDMTITNIKGAGFASMSKTIEVVISNDDFYPKIQFLDPVLVVDERQAGFYLPYEAVGTFYVPMQCILKFNNNSAIAGIHYDLPIDYKYVDSVDYDKNRLYITIDKSGVDSIFIPLLTENVEQFDDITFNAQWTIQKYGALDKHRKANITVEDVKVASFANSELMAYAIDDSVSGRQRIEIPIEFDYVPASGATASLELSGMDAGFTWIKQVVTVDKDTIVSAILDINAGVELPEVLEINIKQDGVLDIEPGVAAVKRSIAISKTFWEVESFSSEYEPAKGFAANLIDGKDDTFWNTSWTNPLVPPPHEVIIDMGANIAIYSVELTSRSGNKSPSVIDVSFSSDQVNWSEPFSIQLFDALDDPSTQRKFPAFAHIWMQGRYLKVYVEASNNDDGAVAFAEVDVRGIRILNK